MHIQTTPAGIGRWFSDRGWLTWTCCRQGMKRELGHRGLLTRFSWIDEETPRMSLLDALRVVRVLVLLESRVWLPKADCQHNQI